MVTPGGCAADNRFILGKIAQGLKVALSDLTGQIGLAPDYERGDIRAAVYQLMQTAIETDLDDPPGPLDRALHAGGLRSKRD